MVWEFDDFYDAYQKKVGKKAAQKAWTNCVGGNLETRRKIMEHVPKYVASTPDKKFRKHPATYLNGECWEDEIITSDSKQNSSWATAASDLKDKLMNGKHNSI